MALTMNPGFGNVPTPPKQPQTIGSDAVFGGGAVDLEDPFEPILDKALEVAFAPIIAEYNAAKERRMADLSSLIVEAKARSMNG